MMRWLAAFVVILIVGGGWLWWSRPPVSDAAQAAVMPGPGMDRPAPDFTLTTLDGKPFTLSALRGKPVVLNFWATWCIPCRNELPTIQRAAAHYGDRVVFAGVDQGETAETVQRFVAELGLTFPIPMDGKQDAATLYNVRGLPTTYFIDADGVIQAMWLGEMTSITLAENIAKIVK